MPFPAHPTGLSWAATCGAGTSSNPTTRRPRTPVITENVPSRLDIGFSFGGRAVPWIAGGGNVRVTDVANRPGSVRQGNLAHATIPVARGAGGRQHTARGR